MLNPIVGSVPRGDDYFGQKVLIDNLWAKLSHNNILLAAPRRFGKTAAMYRLLDEPRVDFVPLYTNLEHIRTAGDFMIELISVIHQKRQFKKIVRKLWDAGKELGAFIRGLPEDIDIGGFKVNIREHTDVAEHWLSYGERLMNLLASEKPSLLLLMDEFAVMLDHILARDPEEAEQLLNWFRVARQAPDTNTRFVLGGSIHLIPMLVDKGMVETVNDLYIQKIKPFPVETARTYLDTVFQSQRVKLAEEVREHILQVVGTPIPYLLAVLVTAIFDHLRATGGGISVETVNTVFEEDLLGGLTSATFYHYRSRLKDYYHDWEAHTAKRLLGALSRSEGSVKRDVLYGLFLESSKLKPSPRTEESFMSLMNKLENDFYIAVSDGGYNFFSRVLKLWWRNRYGFQVE